jgi:hypothetical protein
MNTGHHTFWADHMRQGGDGHLRVNTVRTARGPARPVYILQYCIRIHAQYASESKIFSHFLLVFFTKI